MNEITDLVTNLEKTVEDSSRNKEGRISYPYSFGFFIGILKGIPDTPENIAYLKSELRGIKSLDKYTTF